MAIAYRELPPPPSLRPHVACLWTSHDRAVRVLPDACVDVVLDGGRVVVAGPATVAVDAPATPGLPRCGVRFRVGAAGAALGLPAAELQDLSVPLAELWGRAGRRLEERVLAAASAGDALAALAGGLATRLDAARPAGDPLVRAAALAVVRDGASVPEAGRRVGLGERQLRRRFEQAVGFGPATLQRIQRFQRFLTLAERGPAATLARLAADAGYADEAHLGRECRRLAGETAGTLLRAGAAAAGDKSVSFKPGAAPSPTLSA
jgi:AraC-like DNA-binding protein